MKKLRLREGKCLAQGQRAGRDPSRLWMEEGGANFRAAPEMLELLAHRDFLWWELLLC